MATIPAANYISDAARTEAQVKTALEDTIASLRQVPGAAQTELTATIASGSITPAGAGGVVVIDTESAAATDDLTNIVTTNYPDGAMLLLRNSNAARTVVVKHLAGGAGQLNLDRSGEYALDDTKKWILIQRRSSDWYEVFRGPQKPLSELNPIINGSMEVWQRGTTFTSAANLTYTADRWIWEQNGAGVVDVRQSSSSVPTITQAGMFFNYSLEVDVTTADASIASTDFYLMTHRIEGFNWRQFAQRQCTVSFWVYATKTGTHCVALRNNSAPDRSYIAEYTINTTNTWEYKTFTFSPSPSAGNWDYTTAIGLSLSFILTAGSSFHTTANAWNTGNLLCTSGQVNSMDSASNFFRLTGVKLELGPVATPLQHIPFNDELQRCQRYYQKSFPYATTPAQAAGTSGMTGGPQGVAASTATTMVTIPFRVRMRGNTTITTYNPQVANALIRNTSAGSDTTSNTPSNQSEVGFIMSYTSAAGSAAGHFNGLHWTADAEL